MQLKVGIIGLGVVGSHLKRYFEEYRSYKHKTNLFLFDSDPKKNYSDDINKAEVIFICVSTPCSSNGNCDLSAVKNSIESIKKNKIVVIKSTVPPGTTELVQRERPDLKLFFNPEFLTEKNAWHDFIRPDRQIVGFTKNNLDPAYLLLSLLPKAPFMSPWGIDTYRAIRITATEAEIIKYASNIWFIRKVNFANVLATLCSVMCAQLSFEILYENVRTGFAADYRIGDSHLDVNHGGYKGWGGRCFPKDIKAFIKHLESLKLCSEADLLKGDLDFNIKVLKSQGLSLDIVSKQSEHNSG